jgi:hypothetical protein
MTKLNYLLECLAEECAEVQHIKSKIIRFGMEDMHPTTEVINRHQLVGELHDLLAVIELIMEEDQVLKTLVNTGKYEHIEHKKKKIEKYMQYSKTKVLKHENTNTNI